MEQELEKLEGTVENITFHSEDTGFTVLDLATSATELVTVVGELLDVAEGEHLSLMGTYTVHPSYGQQFRAALCQRTLPSGANAILKYLSSRAVKGVGPVLAARLVQHFGEATLEVLEKTPTRLSEVTGISPKKAAEIAEDFRRLCGVRFVMLFLSRYGVHPSICVRVWKKWGTDAVELLKDNPYLLCAGDLGLAFAQADEIAGQLGFAPDDAHRIAAGLLFVLRHNLGNGHTCLPQGDLLERTAAMLELDTDAVGGRLADMVEEEDIVAADIGGRLFLYLPELWCAERHIAGRLVLARDMCYKGDADFSMQIDALEQTVGIHYEALQRKAIAAALQNGVFILTGGPGTGKTTTINAIIELFEQMGEKVLLAAPTGRAAKRMTELTGREAKTLHRLLEVEFRSGDLPTFRRGEKNPLDAGVIIVDEMSMVDTLLFESLLRAMRLTCRLVLVGDADQLPSVGAGNLLRDMIASEALCTVELREIFRQAAQSMIVTNAHRIVRGEYPELSARDNDFFYISGTNPEDVTQTLLGLMEKRLPKAYGLAPQDIQVLSPTRRAELGTAELNRRLQAVLNPPSPEKREFKIAGCTFREGDKIMQTKNNYNITWEREDGESGLGVFNGDIGEIMQIDPATRMALLRFDERRAEYSFDLAVELELAYAVTVHKAQGSEFEAVIIPLMGGSRNLYYRNLLYTAVTRAKRLLILLGSKESIRGMVDNNRKTKRYTGLVRLLKKESGMLPAVEGTV